MRQLMAALERFWCAPENGDSLTVPRVLLGSLLFYSLFAYWPHLEEFFSAQGWLTPELHAMSGRAPYNLTWLSLLKTERALRSAHLLAMFNVLLFTAGIFLWVTAPLTALTALAYVNYNDFILFGFDQTLTPLLLYLVFHRRQRCRGNQVAKRFMQLHTSLIYISAGFSKLHLSWFNGVGLWRVLATYETSRPELAGLVHELAQFPWLLTVAGATVVLWECSHPVLLWVRPLRPLTLAMAVAIHGGIAIFMRLGAFSLVMLAANATFVDPTFWKKLGLWLKASVAFGANTCRILNKPNPVPLREDIEDDTYA